MSLRTLCSIFSLFLLTISQQTYGQIIADFTFDDTSDMPASLMKNEVGQDAIGINPNARSDGDGVFTLADPTNSESQQNIDLEIPESLLNYTESVYLEFDFRSQEEFAWLIFSGYVPGLDLFRFAHVNSLNDPDQRGFHVRYSTKARPDLIITSGYVGEPMARGERAIVAFMYSKTVGAAYIFKNGKKVWETPEEQRTPGHGLHWQTADGKLIVAANMDGEASTLPSLYRFRAFEQPCLGVYPPSIENTTICKGEQASLKAYGGEEGQYRWYRRSQGEVIRVDTEGSSSFTTPPLSDSETYYVSIADDLCESVRVPVQVKAFTKPPVPKILPGPYCGRGEVTLVMEKEQEKMQFVWFGEDGSEGILHYGPLTLQVEKDTVVYVKARFGGCESEMVAVPISPLLSPSVDAGPDHSIMKGESVVLEASGDFSSCSWTSADEVLDNPYSPTIRVSPAYTREYIVTAINDNGCELRDTVMVFVMNRFQVPNAFSPNNDGINDQWIIPNIEKYPECIVKVFNRWGNEVFYSEGYQIPWDGTHNGTPLPSGTYYYTLLLNNEERLIKGTLLVIR